MGSGDELRIYIMELANALQQNIPPPPIPPDLPAGAVSEIDMLLAGLGMAGNAGDPADMAAAEAGFAQRGLQTGDAMTKFPANEDQSAKAMEQVASTVQQIPQAASGIGQGFGSMFGGLFQAINQAMQQGVQAGSQLANGIGKGGQGAELAELPADALGDTLGAGEAALGAGGAAGGAAAGVAESTTPTGYLGPPPIPSASTFPASAPRTPMPPPAIADPAAESRGPISGYPMTPPAAVGGAGGTASTAKPDTKRVVVPSVKNGAPVQGRITVPQTLPEVVKRIDGKPVASKRIITTDPDTDDHEEPGR